MKIEQALQAKEILEEIYNLRAIATQIQQEPTHWWAFKSPGCKRENDGDGLYFPESLHKEFPQLINSLILILENKIKQL